MAASDMIDGLDAETRESLAMALWVDDLSPENVPTDILERLSDPKNSNRAFGERMQTRIRALLDDR